MQGLKWTWYKMTLQELKVQGNTSLSSAKKEIQGERGFPLAQDAILWTLCV
jgi:hypothetical protein